MTGPRNLHALMIGRLTGTVVAESVDGTLVLDVNGVGYEVSAPLGTRGRVESDALGRITLLVHTHVREDAIVLFAFADERERTAFRLLTAVAGVGPKIAIGVLGSLPANELVGVIARNDVKRLQAVPGVGKKIAERLALELKDKIAQGILTSSSGPVVLPVGAPVPVRTASAGPLVDTLVRMGFRAIEAERAASELTDRAAEPIEAQVRAALALLTR